MIELIKSLPDDIMEELYFKSQVDEGLAQLDRGEGIPHADVENQILKDFDMLMIYHYKR